MKLKIFTILSLLFFASCQPKSKQVTKESHGELTSKIDSIISSHDFNGVVLLTKDSVTLYEKAIGYSDLEHKTVLNLNDQFVIGSISKQITAVLILKAYENGKIELDDKINKYLPDLSQDWSNKVTIHHLLTHTHGIIDLEEPLEFEQGTQFHYSQLGYELLSLTLQNISGKSFNELSTEFLVKYKLNHTFHPENKNYQNLVKGYIATSKDKLEYATNSLRNYAAAGSFISNAEDLNKWNILLYSGKLVNEKTLKLMKTRYATRTHPIFDTVEYGYGLLFKDGENDTQIGALGYAPGFVSACYHYPKTDMNLIVLENIAYNLNNFEETFQVHTKLMELIKNESL